MNKIENNDLQEHLMRLARMMRRHPAGDQHISRSSLQLIRIILMEDGIRTSELAQRLDIRPSSLTDLLKRLEEDGDITRERDEQDSRILRVHATDKARAGFARRQAERACQAERLRACLSEEEYETFCAICDKLSAFLEAEYGNAGGRCGQGCHGEHKHHHGCGGGGRGRCLAHGGGELAEDGGEGGSL